MPTFKIGFSEVISLCRLNGLFGLGNHEVHVLRTMLFIEQTDLCVARLNALEKEEG